MSLGTRLTSVDLPLPVLPTNATVWPGCMVRLMSSNTARASGLSVPPAVAGGASGVASEAPPATAGGTDAYSKTKSRNSILPSIGGCSSVPGASFIDGIASRMARKRLSEAVPRCHRLTTKPRAMRYQIIRCRYRINAVKSPAVISPRTAIGTPTATMITKPRPMKKKSSGRIAAENFTSRRFCAAYSRFST